MVNREALEHVLEVPVVDEAVVGYGPVRQYGRQRRERVEILLVGVSAGVGGDESRYQHV